MPGCQALGWCFAFAHEPSVAVGAEFAVWDAAWPSSFMNLFLSLVTSSSRIGRKRHRRSRISPCRGLRGVPPLLGSAKPVVAEESVPIRGQVEISLDRSEPPVAGGGGVSLLLWNLRVH